MELKTYRLYSLSILILCTLSLPLMAAEKKLILAIHPYLPVAEIKKRFTPFADYLSRELGRPVSIRVGGDYEQHITAIGRDQVDIAFLGPAAYVNLVENYGQKRLLARFEVAGNPKLYGVIAVQKSSTLKNLVELTDKRFAFGDPRSTMSHMIPRYMMLQAGIPHGAPETHNFLGSHKNVALGVLTGDYDAGAMKKEVFDEYKVKGLRALAITPGVPDHLFVASNKLDASLVKKLTSAMLGLKDRKNGPQILTAMHKKLTALVAADNHEYDELREMIKTVQAVSE